MKKILSRYEINQKIKSILVSNGADVTTLTFSFSGRTARFTGRFTKTTGAAMSQAEIETLCKALIALPAVQHLNFDMEDWNIFSSPGSFFFTRKVISAIASVREQKPLIIRTRDGVLMDEEEKKDR